MCMIWRSGAFSKSGVCWELVCGAGELFGNGMGSDGDKVFFLSGETKRAFEDCREGDVGYFPCVTL